MMEKTKKIKRTFTQAEVDSYIKKMMASSELALCEQKDRIVELKTQIDKLNAQLEESKQKQKDLSKAMNESSRIGKDIKKEIDTRRKIEVEKFRAFGFRWKNYLDQLFASIPQLDGNKSNILFEQEMLALLDEMQELNTISTEKNGKKIPTSKKDTLMSEEEWMKSVFASSSVAEKDENLSDDNLKRYNDLMRKLKDDMVFASMISAPSDDFDISEALNPKDDLNKILGDIL